MSPTLEASLAGWGGFAFGCLGAGFAIWAVLALVGWWLERREPEALAMPAPDEVAARANLHAKLASLPVRDLLHALRSEGRAELAAQLLIERLETQADAISAGELETLTATHDLSAKHADGSTGSLPTAPLRRLARRELVRRGREPWGALLPAAWGVRPTVALDGHENEVRALRTLPRGGLLSAADDFQRILWSIERSSELARLGPADDALGHLWARREGDRVRLVRPTTGALVRELELPHGRLHLSPDEQHGLVVEGDPWSAGVSLFGLGDGSRVWRRTGYQWDHEVGDSLGVGFSPAGRFVALTWDYGMALQVLEAATGALVLDSPRGPRLMDLGPEPLAVFDADGRLEVRDLTNGATVATMEAAAVSARLLPDRRHVVWANETTIALVGFDGSNRFRRELGATGIADVGTSPDGRLVFARARFTWDERERWRRPQTFVWNLDGERVAEIDRAGAVALLPDGRIATGDRWGTIWLWERSPAARSNESG